MRYFDKNLLREYTEDFQKVFTECSIKEVKIYFAPLSEGDSISFYITPSDESTKLRKKIINLFGRKKLAGIIYIHGTKAFGQEITIPEGTIDFNELLEEARASRDSVVSVVIEENNKPNIQTDATSELVKEESEKVVRKIAPIKKVLSSKEYRSDMIDMEEADKIDSPRPRNELNLSGIAFLKN